MSIRNLILAAVAICAPLSATTSYTFDFTAGSGSFSSLSAYSGVLGITVSAFYTSNASTTLAAATVGQYSGAGLGICNPSSESSCSSPEHQIDNNGRYEFMLFKFSAPVSLSTIALKNFGGAGNSIDRDITYYTSSSSASSITLGSLSNLGGGFGTGTTVNCTGVCTGATTVDSLSGNAVTYLLLGAAGPGAGDGGKDYFKITGLTVTTSSIGSDAVVAAPEPSTVSMVLVAAAGIGWMSRRRAQCVKS